MDKIYNKNYERLFVVSLLVIGLLTTIIFYQRYEIKGLELHLQDVNIRNNEIAQERLNDYRLQFDVEGIGLYFDNLKKGRDQLKQFYQQESRYVVAILFTNIDCGPVVLRELRLWQEIYSIIAGRYNLSIVAIANTSNFDKFGFLLRGIFQYPLLLLDSSESDETLFSTLSIPRGQPLVILFDRKNQKIIYAHLGSLQASDKSEKFIKKIGTFLDIPEINSSIRHNIIN